MTWCTIDADNALVYLAEEAVTGTPITIGARQMHILSGGHSEGHTPYERPPHPGHRQPVMLDAKIIGSIAPVVQLTFPARYEDLEMLLASILGGASVAGAWSVASTLPSYSIGIMDGNRYWIYAGCKVESAAITSSPGSTVELQLTFSALTRTTDATGVYTALGLTTAPTYSPYVWEEFSVLGGAGSPPATVLEPDSVTINFGNTLHKTRAPGVRGWACQTVGRLEVNGSLGFNYSATHYSTLQAVCDAYTVYYLAMKWTTNTGGKFVNIELPSKLMLAQHVMPEGSTPQRADVVFSCAADDFSLTTPTVKASSTAY